MIPRNPIDVKAASAAFDRFMAKVDDNPNPASSCWEWNAGTFSDGYGRFTLEGHYHQAHRIAWAQAFRRDPGQLNVLHECHNPPCVNPLHLVPGDQRLNMEHAKARGTLTGCGSPGEANPSAKLTERDVREIRALATVNGVTLADIASKYGVTRQHVSAVVNGESWSHV